MQPGPAGAAMSNLICCTGRTRGGARGGPGAVEEEEDPPGEEQREGPMGSGRGTTMEEGEGKDQGRV